MQPRVTIGTDDGLYELGEREELRFEGHKVSALVRERASHWAVIDNTTIWRAADGREWRQVADSGSLVVNCVLPREGYALVGTADAHLLTLRDGLLSRVRAFDEAPGRDTWHTPSGAPPDTRSLTFDAEGTLYANVHVGGVVRATDVAGSWEPTIEVEADVHEVVFDASSGTLFAASAIGLASSADGGTTWKFETEGLHGAYQRAVAVAGETVLVSASTGPHSDRGAMYRKPIDKAAPFTKCEHGLPEWFPSNINTFCLSAAGDTAAFGTSEGEVYLSTDRGVNWSRLAENLPAVRALVVV